MKSLSIQKLQAAGYILLRVREMRDERFCIFQSRSFGSWEKFGFIEPGSREDVYDFYNDLLNDTSNMYISDTHIVPTLHKLIPAGYTCVEQTDSVLFIHNDKSEDDFGTAVPYATKKRASARLKELEQRENFIAL